MTTIYEYEAQLVNDVRIEMGARIDTRLFRNSVGLYTDKHGNVIRYGLCNGSSDLIGFKTITITPDMVGRQVAVFVALEGKMPTKYATSEQRNFIQMVRAMGGRAGVFKSLSQAMDIIEGA